MNNTKCSTVLKEISDADITSELYKEAYRKIDENSMTNEGWAEAQTNAEKIMNSTKDKTSPEWLKNIDDFYT